MPLNSYIRKGDNAELTEEREKATFPTEELAKEIHGAFFEKRRELSQYVADHKELHDPVPHAFQTREERIMEASRKISLLVQRPEVATQGDFNWGHLMNEVIGIEGHPVALHNVMFIPSLRGQADDEQLKEFLPRAERGEIIGTYAQTEMGHGTNLRALETTATYDKTTQEFVINSPTITSHKWWPGNLGKSSNYAVVAAQLFIDGKCYGPHNFIMQLRDEKTHQPCKGITVGDIGPKMAYNTTDNGFLKFDHVRIPRRAMLMRHAKVSPGGEYTKPPHSKIGYGAMVYVRSYMICGQSHMLAMAATIATRYSCVRRQGEITPGKGEVKIIEYQTQQHRLFPQIARAYAYWFSGKEVIAMYTKTLDEIKLGKVDLMADLHAVTSGMKSVVSFECGNAIEQCRMSCGGHGYSEASRMSEIYGVQIGGCTYEGENMVMLLQLARYLMKAAGAARSGKHLSPLAEYLAEQDTPSLIDRENDPTSKNYIKAFEYVARRLTFRAFDRLVALQKSGLSKEDAWQANAVEMTRASRAHTRLFIAKTFQNKVHSDLHSADPRVKEVLVDLLNLYLNYELLDLSHYLLEDQYLSSSQLTHIRDCVYLNLSKIRPNAVSLVDAFDITDNELRSVLGRRDGNVYENLLKWAKASNLNKNEVLPSYEKYLKPVMEHTKNMSKL